MRDNCTIIEIADKYINDVLSGVVVACELTKQACMRQRNNLNDGVDGYVFDVKRAVRIVKYIEKLKHVKGAKFAGKNIVLEPWQIFNLTTIYGWVDEMGYRRFRTVYWGTGRKSGKSLVASGIALYALTEDGEAGAEVYAVAAGREQAKVVYDAACTMASGNSDFMAYYGIKKRLNMLSHPSSNSVFKPLAKDMGGTHDGLNTHLAVMDEVHAWKGRAQYEVIETSLGSRDQPMIFIITTAGFNLGGICYEIQGYAKTVLSGKVIDDTMFANIYTLDDGDEWSDQEVWIKANPNLGVSTSKKDLEIKSRAALQMPSRESGFLTKNMNVWTTSSSSWLGSGLWDSAADSGLSIDSFAGMDCVIGLDLSSRIDMTSMAIMINADNSYVLFTKHYLPERAIKNSGNVNYVAWGADRHINVTPGASISMTKIRDDIMSLSKKMNITSVAYDPFNASMMAEELSTSGLDLVEMRQSKNNFSDPMKMIEALLLDGKIIHDGNPVMGWMVDNVEASVDPLDRIYPTKQLGGRDLKIDGVVAMIMAMNRARLKAAPKAYKDRGILKF